MVGAVRFELTTSWTRTTRASQATLRPATKAEKVADARGVCNVFLKHAIRHFSQSSRRHQ